MTPVLELHQVEKRRGSFRLGPIDLAVESGMVAALVGPNGSGKSTLFRTLMGLIRPDRGEVRLFGEPLTPGNDAAAKARIGYAAEPFAPLDDQMTVEQWGKFVARWYPSWDEPTWRRLVERLELEPDKKLKELSAGTSKRLDFALALSRDPELLLLDEPSSGLDPFAWRIMIDEMQRYMESGNRTAFIATHSMEEVRRLADVIVFMYQGQMIGVYEKDSLLAEWKTMWVQDDVERVRQLPGVVSAEPTARADVVRIVTREAERAEAELRLRGTPPLEMRAVELEDILWHLMEQNQNGSV